jgi:hypothetical protein
MAHHHRLSIQKTPQTLSLMKSKPPAKYDPLKLKLTPAEQAIEDSRAEAAPASAASPELLAAVKAGFTGLAVSPRGGKRRGSGRKPRETRRTVVLLAPEVRARLEQLAEKTGSLSSAVEKAVMALRD